jgi:hypothetical protein
VEGKLFDGIGPHDWMAIWHKAANLQAHETSLPRQHRPALWFDIVPLRYLNDRKGNFKSAV